TLLPSAPPSDLTAPTGSAWSGPRRCRWWRPRDERPPTPVRRAAGARQRILRRRRVRTRLRAPQPDRTARHRPRPPGAARTGTPAADDGGGPVRHHGLLPDARRGRRADGGPPAGARLRLDPPAAGHGAPARLRHRARRGGLLPPRRRGDAPEEPR